jgi:phosphatidylglycerophosphate synthase
MLAGIAAGACLAATSHFDGWQARLLWVAGGACVQLRLLANMFDGMVAIETGTASPVGALYNEVPDRVSDSATLIGLGYAMQSLPELGYLAALFAVATAYIRAMVKVAGAPQDFCGPMAKQQRMFLVTMTALFFAVAPTAWRWRAEAGWGIPAVVLGVIAVGSLFTAVRRLSRGAKQLRGASNPSAARGDA